MLLPNTDITLSGDYRTKPNFHIIDWSISLDDWPNEWLEAVGNDFADSAINTAHYIEITRR